MIKSTLVSIQWRYIIAPLNWINIDSVNVFSHRLTFNKSDVKCWNTLGCLDQYICKVLRLWNSRDHETGAENGDMKRSGLWSSLGTHGCLVVIWWLCISSSSETRKFEFWHKIWPWRSRSIAPQNNRDLNQGNFHLWSKYGGPSLNGWWVIARRSSKWV